jgi:hypothetical protein
MTSLLTVLQGSADGIGSVRRFILCWLPMIPMLMRYYVAPAFTVIVAFGAPSTLPPSGDRNGRLAGAGKQSRNLVM